MTLYCAGLLPLCYYPYLHQTSQRGHPHLHRSDNSSRHQTMGRMDDVMIVMGTSLDPTFTINGDNPELDRYIMHQYISRYLDMKVKVVKVKFHFYFSAIFKLIQFSHFSGRYQTGAPKFPSWRGLPWLGGGGGRGRGAGQGRLFVRY